MAGAEKERKAQAGRGKPGAAPHGNGTAGPGNGPVLMDLEFVRHLIEAVDGSGIDTLEITRAGTRIRISKSPAQVAGSVGGGQAPAATAQAPAPAAQDPAQEAAEAEPAKKGPALTDVNSPMVGTFYRAPAPEAPPYVEVGSTVSKGQTLCILEAMKLMNELESEVDGVVREICVANGEPVEYGQVLFRVEPA